MVVSTAVGGVPEVLPPHMLRHCSRQLNSGFNLPIDSKNVYNCNIKQPNEDSGVCLHDILDLQLHESIWLIDSIESFML